MPINKDIKRDVRRRMADTSQSYMTARRHVLSRTGAAPDDDAVRPGDGTTTDRPSGLTADALGRAAIGRCEEGGLLLLGVHAGVAEAGAAVEVLVTSLGFSELFLAWPRSWQRVVDEALRGMSPSQLPTEPADATADLLDALLRLGRLPSPPRGVCVGMTPELGPSAREWDVEIGRIASAISAQHSPDAAAVVLIRPFNICTVPYKFRGEHALPWTAGDDAVFRDADIVHPLGAQLAASGENVHSIQLFGPDAPDPHNLRHRLGIGVLQAETWTKAPPLAV